MQRRLAKFSILVWRLWIWRILPATRARMGTAGIAVVGVVMNGDSWLQRKIWRGKLNMERLLLGVGGAVSG